MKSPASCSLAFSASYTSLGSGGSAAFSSEEFQELPNLLIVFNLSRQFNMASTSFFALMTF